MRNVSDKIIEKLKHTFMFNKFFPENRTVFEIRWKNVVEPERPLTTVWNIGIACWISKATDTLRIYNTYNFSNATMIARKSLNVTFIRTLPFFCIQS
jgi:hypothetical protein